MMNSLYVNQKNKKKMVVLLQQSFAMMTSKVPCQQSLRTVRGMLLKKSIELAKQNNIQMQEDASLVSALLNIDLGESIPPQLYAVIAEILILLEELDRSY